MAEPVRVLLAEPDTLVREGVRALLQDEFAIVGEAGDGRQAVEQALQTRPDVVVMEAVLPELSGPAAAERVLKRLANTRILILTARDDEQTVHQCVEAGVHGYVLKRVTAAELRQHIRTIAAGEHVLDSRIAPMVIARVRAGALENGGWQAQSDLSEQQMAILRLIARGLSNREIAAELHLSESTIKGYAAEILRVLGVKNRVEAAHLAIRRGWVEP